MLAVGEICPAHRRPLPLTRKFVLVCIIRKVIYSDGETASALYSSFSIGDEASTQYTITVNGYSGTLGRDALDADAGNISWKSNGMRFGTYDRDNDLWASGNCASSYGWWLRHCTSSVLNVDGPGYWVRFGSVTNSRMKVRRL